MHGETVAGHVFLRGQGEFGSVQARARGDKDLRAHEVDAGDLLGHGVLDLDARVHLDEEPLVAVVIVEELDGAGVVVADALGDFHRGVAQVGADIARQVDGRRDLDDFLVAALHGAVALVEVEDAAVGVAENLHFDVLGARNVFLKEDGGVTEGASGFVAGFVEERDEIAFLAHDAHAASAAAEGRLDDERKADFFRDLERFTAFGHGLFGAGQNGDTEFDGQSAGRGFVAHHFEEVGARPDKRDAGFLAGAGEVSVFGKEPVARMDHADAAFAGEANDAFDVEVGADRTFAASHDVGLVRFEAMDGEAIFLGVDRDGAQAEFGGGAENADGDLAAVGDEQGAAGHVDRCRNWGCLSGGHSVGAGAYRRDGRG